ncbi:MAG: hypothetical protein GYB68_10000, partial [Chloroflexi bacterium]|nr:hypothetical protein [Chloroflexota bacterium]
ALDLRLDANDLTGGVRLAQRIVSEFVDADLDETANQIRAAFNERLKEFGLALADSASSTEPARANLPAQCPACLGPVRADEVSWINDHRAQCAFCGSPLEVVL